MAPEQGPNSKSQREKKETVANEEESAQSYENSSNDSSTQNLSKDSVGWIYLLRKDQLIEQCRNADVPTVGFTVEHLRKQLANNLRMKKLRKSTENVLLELEREISINEQSVVPEEMSFSIPKATPLQNLSDTDIINTIHGWDLKFSGDTDLIEFLERLEELAECHLIPHDRLIPAILSVLSGNALKWFRIKRDTIRSWSNFRHEMEKFFLPSRYLTQLEQNFYNRKQHNRERAKDYILHKLTLSRQHPILRNGNHLDQIYDGLRPEYRYYVRRSDFTDLDELISMTDEYEALRREECPQTSHMMSNLAYTREDHCWRCKGLGHTRMSCVQPARLFCSYCGKDGVLSRSCRCQNRYQAKPILDIPLDDTRYYVTVTIHGEQFRALVDTGSSRTYIAASVTQHLRYNNISPHDTQSLVQMADKSMARCLSVFSVPITHRNATATLPVSMIESLAEPIILGMDFLEAVGIEIRLNGELIPNEPRNEKLSQVKGLRTVASHTIGLRHGTPIEQRYITRKPTPPQRLPHNKSAIILPVPYQATPKPTVTNKPTRTDQTAESTRRVLPINQAFMRPSICYTATSATPGRSQPSKPQPKILEFATIRTAPPNTATSPTTRRPKPAIVNRKKSSEKEIWEGITLNRRKGHTRPPKKSYNPKRGISSTSLPPYGKTDGAVLLFTQAVEQPSIRSIINIREPLRLRSPKKGRNVTYHHI